MVIHTNVFQEKVGSQFVVVEPQPAVRDGWSTKSKKTEISQDIAREKARDLRSRGGEGESAGWTGEVVQPQSRGHPLLEQKEILRGYLRQVSVLVGRHFLFQSVFLAGISNFCQHFGRYFLF